MADLYYAKWHVRLGEEVIRPGEVFEADGADPEILRLIGLDAIAPTTCEEAGISEEELTEAEHERTANVCEAEEEHERTVPVCEFDVMDGIVSKPKRRSKK